MNNSEYNDFMHALNHAAIITETNLKGEIIFVNEKFVDISGYLENELLGKTHAIVNSGKHPKAFFGTMWKTIKDGQVWFGEVCNRKKNGSLYWVHATIFPIRGGAAGDIYKYAAIRFDITEKKEAELQTQHIASKYQSIIEVTDGFCHIDAKGQFIEVSDGYCELTGYTREELLKMNILKMGEDFSLSLYQLGAILKLHGKTLEIPQHRKDGSTWIAEITASYSTLKDGTVFIFLHDVTERREIEKNNKELQQQVNQMQKLDSIGRLTAGVAHDFNNILAGILGYNEINKMILDDLPENENKWDLKHNLEQIENGIKRGAELIDKLLIYCRQNTAKEVIYIKPTFEVLTEATNLLASVLTKKYQLDLELDETLFIKIDSTDLHQIVTNLVVNARDAMSQGHIRVKLSAVKNIDEQCVACSLAVTGDFIELSVSDNGSGIDETILTRIFDPFFTTKEVGKGTGLGLSVLSGLVHNANGHILVDSKIGEGTAFRLFFPFAN